MDKLSEFLAKCAAKWDKFLETKRNRWTAFIVISALLVAGTLKMLSIVQSPWMWWLVAIGCIVELYESHRYFIMRKDLQWK